MVSSSMRQCREFVEFRSRPVFYSEEWVPASRLPSQGSEYQASHAFENRPYRDSELGTGLSEYQASHAFENRPYRDSELGTGLSCSCHAEAFPSLHLKP